MPAGVLARAAELAAASRHPYAKAVVRAARAAGASAIAARDVKEIAGFGLERETPAGSERLGSAVWCGTTAAQNRPAVQTGRPIRVIYAYPSDGEDRSAQLATRISADVDDILAWWRYQDPTREPRFDLTSFSCGLQVDLTAVRLPESGVDLSSGSAGIERIFRSTVETSRDSIFQSYLVYYDGPVDNANLCGIAYGADGGPGQAIVFLRACDGVPSEAVAAHELLHTLGALADSGPPHACPDTRGHPCDSEQDILYPYASTAPLSSFVLDVGHDDYYAHAGSWPDVQDSLWLRHLDVQTRLSLSITGPGDVVSDVPGLDCAASCGTDSIPKHITMRRTCRITLAP